MYIFTYLYVLWFILHFAWELFVIIIILTIIFDDCFVTKCKWLQENSALPFCIAFAREVGKFVSFNLGINLYTNQYIKTRSYI